MRRAILIVSLLLIPPGVTLLLVDLDLGNRALNRVKYPRRFAEVEEGRLYRGGYPSAQDIRHLKADFNIETVLSLTGPVDTEEERELMTAIQQLGLRHVRIPMPGNGCGEMADLDAAANAIYNAGRRPIFFHCQAGKQRSNAALAAYRMKYCGWSFEQTMKELQLDYDLDLLGKEQVLVDHLKEYARHVGLPSSSSTENEEPEAPASEQTP